MKILPSLTMIILVALLASCSTGKNAEREPSVNETLPILTVTQIEDGKDGYTASLVDDNDGKYTMVVSIPNLGDNFIALKPGDKIQAQGEYAKSYPVQIFATSILLINESTKNDNDGFIIGEVEEIEYGKDGYTATIKTPDNEYYWVTISIPNLGKNGNYRSAKKGETIEVKGEVWEMDGKKMITARELKPHPTIRICVASKTVDCMGMIPQKCMLIKRDGQADWEYDYDGIEGFEYEADFEYILDIREIHLSNPPADASSIRRVLVKQVSKTKKVSENLPE